MCVPARYVFMHVVFVHNFFAFPSGSTLLAGSAFILYLCLLVLYALHILLQLCLKIIRNEKKKQGVRKVDSGRSCGIH